MSRLSRNILSSRGTSSSLYPTLRQQRRPKTFGLRERWRNGTRTWTHCRSFRFPYGFIAKSSIQSCTTVVTYHTLPLCEAVYKSRHPYWHPCDIDAPSFPNWFVLLRIPFFLNQLNISRADIPCVLENGVTKVARSTQPVTLYITVNITPLNLYDSPPSIPIKDDDPPAEATKLGRIQFPVPEHILPPSHHQSVESSNAMSQSRREISPTRSTENPGFAHDWADKPVKQIVPNDRRNTWERAVGRIKWVMDTLGPIAEVRSFLMFLTASELIPSLSFPHSQRWRMVYF